MKDLEKRVKRLETENEKLKKKIIEMDNAFNKLAPFVMSIAKKLMKLNTKVKSFNLAKVS